MIGELARDRRLVRIAVEGLSQDEVGELVSAWLRKEGAVGLAAELHRRTGGNPLFVEELVRYARDAGRLGEAGLAAGVPAEVSGVIGQRVGRLGERCAEMLAFGAVLGHEFDLRELEEATGLQTDELVESLDAALAARLLREVREGGCRYRFAHDLVQETVYGSLSTARRSWVHLRIADAIEQLHGDDPKRLPELALHLAAAGPASDPERAVRYLLLAAEQARRGFATSEAIELYNEALELIPEDAESRRREVRLNQAVAYAAFSHTEDARQSRGASRTVAGS
jgi:predicted ATPase